MPAFNVKFVFCEKLTEEKEQVLAPRVIVLTLELTEEKIPAVTAYPAVLKVPFVTVSVCDPMFSASAS